MRVGVVTTSYPRYAGDAAGSFVAAHVAYLRGTGATVEVIAAGDPADDPDVHRVPSPLFYGGGAPDALEAGASPRAAAAFGLALTRAVARRAARWDAVVAHWWLPSAIAAALATRRVPMLAIAHGGDIHLARRTRLLMPAALALLARGARLAFVAEPLQADALAALPRALARRVDAASIVQPMGVDLARFAALRRAPRGPVATIAILARLVPIKGVAIAIEALRHVRTPARLVIAGDGPLRAELAARAAAARARGADVELVGALDATARDELLARADLVVVPSIETAGGRAEGTPLVVLEALAAAVPVVASNTGGLAALADDVIARVRPGDARALAAAIDAALAAGVLPGAARAIAGLDVAHVGVALDRHWRR